MADLERGERIKQQREALKQRDSRFTQEHVASEVGVTHRAYQEWEAGGGITWDHARALGKVLGAAPEWIMRGDAPPLQVMDGESDDAIGRLERIEGKLDDVLELLATDRDAAGETDTGSSVEGSRETSGR